MATEYEKAGKGVTDMMERLIREEHHNLLTVIDKISVVMRYPASKSNGEPVLSKVGKFPPRMNTMTGCDYVFFIELAGEEWYQDLDDHAREALLYHCLCSFDVEVSEEEHAEEKPVLVKPEIFGFRQEFEKYGWAWRPQLDPGDEKLPELKSFIAPSKQG